MTRVDGAHAIVTGGSEGIGLATAVDLARRGAHVSLIARRPEVLAAAAETVQRAATGAGRTVRVEVASADVSDRTAVVDAIRRLTDASGPCDLLICAAGYARPGHLDELPADEFERHMAVNYLGVVHAVTAVLPSMRERRRGHVLVTSSTAGLVGVFGYAAYSPTKFAVRGFAEVLRAEVVRDGIRVGIVYPADTATPGFDRENVTKPAETVAISGSIAPVPPERVAAAIVRGIERDRFEITADAPTRVLTRAAGLVGPVLRRVFDRTAAAAVPDGAAPADGAPAGPPARAVDDDRD